MRFSDVEVVQTLTPGTNFNTQVDLENLSDAPLTSLTAAPEGLPAYVQVTMNLPAQLDGGAILTVPYALKIGDVPFPQLVKGRIRVTTAEGAIAYLPVTLTLTPPTARLAATPGFLQGGMTRGQTKFVEFEVANTGGAASGPITVQIPNEPWLSLSTPATRVASSSPRRRSASTRCSGSASR